MVLSTSLYAKDNVFYFCGAKVDAQKKYYVTKLLPGKIQIATTGEFQEYLKQTFKLENVSVKCHGYGRDNSPTDNKTAEKLRKMEVRNNGINAEIVLLEWPPSE